MNQRNIQRIADLSAGERRSVGVPDTDPVLTVSGFAQWEDGDLPIELPANAIGLTSQSSATGTGLGWVQSALAYRRPNGTYLIVALESSDEGRLLLAADAIDLREANAQLLTVMAGWAFCGWETSCRLAAAS